MCIVSHGSRTKKNELKLIRFIQENSLFLSWKSLSISNYVLHLVHCSVPLNGLDTLIGWTRSENRWSKKCVRIQSIGIIYTSSLNRNVGNMCPMWNQGKSSMKRNNRSHCRPSCRHHHIKTIFNNFADIFLLLPCSLTTIGKKHL